MFELVIRQLLSDSYLEGRFKEDRTLSQLFIYQSLETKNMSTEKLEYRIFRAKYKKDYLAYVKVN